MAVVRPDSKFSISSDEPYVDHKFLAVKAKVVEVADEDADENDGNGKQSSMRGSTVMEPGAEEGLGLEDEEDEIDVLTKKVSTLEKSMAEVLIKITEL